PPTRTSLPPPTFLFTPPAPPDTYTLSLHDALPIYHATAYDEQATIVARGVITEVDDRGGGRRRITQSPYRFSDASAGVRGPAPLDRKSTRLNSSHSQISYAVFCLKKKKKKKNNNKK